MSRLGIWNSIMIIRHPSIAGAVAAGLFAALLASGCAHTTVIDTQGMEVIPIGGLGDHIKAKGNPFTDPKRPVLIRLPAGERIPVDLLLRAPFAELEGGSPALRFKRDVYLYFGEGKLLLSFDGLRFAQFGDLQGLKEVAGVSRGQLMFGLKVTEAEEAKISMALEAD
jgi:hypothetical protein